MTMLQRIRQTSRTGKKGKAETTLCTEGSHYYYAQAIENDIIMAPQSIYGIAEANALKLWYN